MELDLEHLNARFEHQSATDILRWTFETFAPGKVAFSTSFGAEGMALLHLMVSSGYRPRVFTIDTARNFQETYDVWHEAVERLGVEIECYNPYPADIRELLAGQGPNLFYESVENRKACCHVRKVRPLPEALAGADVWMTALRREQAESRRDLQILSWSETYGLYKTCPLANWLQENVWSYIRANDVPYNKLYDKGFLTIGCAPCTRPVRPAEGIRSGRWWWEPEEPKECGIHIEGGKVVRKPKTDFQI
jgi:phosphoadenosine phosphosulfate reductase